MPRLSRSELSAKISKYKEEGYIQTNKEVVSTKTILTLVKGSKTIVVTFSSNGWVTIV